MLLPSLDEVQRAVGDRYEVLDLAGAGGMGAVFRARHLALGHVVAIKVLPPEVGTSELRRQRFQREASLAAQLSHPHIVPVYEFDSRDGITFLIMPFVRGVTLSAVLERRQRLELAETLRVVREVGAALEFAHRRGVVHRDVKPSNVLIEEDTGRALLTDFGVARVRHPAESTLTEPGTPVGTPDYMAPEQLAGDEGVDGRADLYALALVAFEALTGTLPLLRTERPALARALAAAHPRCAGPLADALVAPLAERPGDRPASAGAWLERIARAEGVERRRRVGIVAAAAGALAVAAWVAWPRRGPPPVPQALAVMPFEVLRGPDDLPPRQLTESFARRLSAAPGLAVLSGARVWTAAVAHYGPGPLTDPQADSLARALGARYFLQPSATFSGAHVRLRAALHDAQAGHTVADTSVESSVDSLDDLMAAVGEGVLRAVVAGGRELGGRRTLPRGFATIIAYLNADQAFGRGDYDLARALYDRVIARDREFAPAYLRRLLVAAQVSPSEATFREAIAGARLRRSGLEPADSLLLEGYTALVERGDGAEALALFREAAARAPDQPYVRFVLGEVHFYFGPLFGGDLALARREFAAVLDLAPRFAPAIANSIALAHLAGDDREAQRLIDLYHSIDSTSVVAEVVGIVDTVLFGRPADRLRILNETLDRRPFVVLEYLAFQSAQFATPADSAVAALARRRILRALERRAAGDYERALALRWGVAADLAAGLPDSARARLARAGAGTTHERDAWIVLAHVAGLDSLGDWRRAAERLAGDPTGRWLRARATPAGWTRAAALDGPAADSAPLPSSLAIDLSARAALASHDTARALELWDRATARYAVLATPFDLVASLWPIRRDLARTASAARDTARAIRACGTFDALIGYVDQVVRREMDVLCQEWRSVSN